MWAGSAVKLYPGFTAVVGCLCCLRLALWWADEHLALVLVLLCPLGRWKWERVTQVASAYPLIEFALTAAVALVASRFIRFVPAVVLQIIFGIILGAEAFSLSSKDFGIELLANVGLFAIFFGVGLDFDLTAPELTSSTPARSAVAGVSASLVLVFLATLALDHSAGSSFLVGMATVSTSVSVSVYSYLTIGPLSHLEAKLAVLAGLFDDLLGLIALSVLSSLLSGSLKGLISLAVSLIVVLVSYVLKRRLTGKSFQLHPAYRYGLAVVVTVVLVLLWSRFGLTLAIGGFVAGAFSGPILTEGDQRILTRVGGVLGTFFMVSLGLLVRPEHGISLVEVLGVAVLSFAMTVAKWAAALAIGKQVKDRVLYWFSMVPRAEVAGIGLVLIAPRISSSLEMEAVLAVVVTSLIAPLVIMRRAREI